MSKKLLWLGRILGGLAVLFFTGTFYLIAIIEWPIDVNSADFREVLPMVIMTNLQLIFYIITWFPKIKGELIGGIAILIISLCMGGYVMYDAGSNKFIAGLIYCIPFLITGIIFIIYSQTKKE